MIVSVVSVVSDVVSDALIPAIWVTVTVKEESGFGGRKKCCISRKIKQKWVESWLSLPPNTLTII